MNKTEIKLEYNVLERSDKAVPVIIVAAGKSTRMNGVNKQFINILNVPVIAHTLMTFESCPYISKIILVAGEDSILDMQHVCEKYSITKATDIVAGGNNRHESVMNGINRLSCSDLKVLIHDGARPFVKSNTISDVVLQLDVYDAALCVSKINDTVKNVDKNGLVVNTVDRTNLYAAHTPQGVDVAKYKSACEKIENADLFTDDVSIMEAAGYTVKTVLDDGKNIKITTPDDVAVAEAFVKGEL